MREIPCPLCGQPTFLDEAGDSQEVHCQQCAGVFVAPAAAREPVSAPVSVGPDFSGIDADVFLPEPSQASPGPQRTCPVCGADNRVDNRACSSCGEPFVPTSGPGAPPTLTAIRDLSGVFGQSWKIYRRHLGLILISLLGVSLLSYGIAYLLPSPGVVPGPDVPNVSPLLSLGLVVAQLFWSLYWQLGLSKLFLNICRNESPQFADLLVGFSPVLRAGVIMFLVWTAYTLAMVLIVVGLALGVTAAQASQLVMVSVTVGCYALTMPVVIAVQCGVGFVVTDSRQTLTTAGAFRFATGMIGRNFLSLYVLSFCCTVVLIASTFVSVLLLPFALSYLFVTLTVMYLKASGQAAAVATPVPKRRAVETPVVIPTNLE